MTLSKISECSSETDSFFQTVLKTNKNRVIDRSLLTRKQHEQLLSIPRPIPKPEPPPKRKVKRCKIPQICPERIDQLSIPKSIYVIDVLQKFNNTLHPDRVVRLVKLVHAEKEEEAKPRCSRKKPKRKRRKAKRKKQTVEQCIRIWLKKRIQLTTKLIVKHIKAQDQKLTPNYRQLLIALGIMRSLKIKKKRMTMKYTKKYLMNICEQLAIECDNECKPYGYEVAPIEVEPEEEDTGRKHIVWIMKEPPSEEESETEEVEEEEEEEEELVLELVEEEEEEEEEVAEEAEGEEVEGEEAEGEEAELEEELEEETGGVIEEVEKTIKEEPEVEEEEEVVEEEEDGKAILEAIKDEYEHLLEEAESAGMLGDILKDLAEGEKESEGEEEEEEVQEEEEEEEEPPGEVTLPSEAYEPEEMEVPISEMAEEFEMVPEEFVPGEEMLALEEGVEEVEEEEEAVTAVEEPTKEPEVVEKKPSEEIVTIEPEMEIVPDHPPNTVSYLAWTVYSSWLEEFGNNMNTYGKCLRNFREILESKVVSYSDTAKIESILTNWGTYLRDSLDFERQITETFKGKPISKCVKCGEYTLYNIPPDHEIPPELKKAAESTARWRQLLTEAEKLCRSFQVADDVSILSHETIEIDNIESLESSGPSEYSLEILSLEEAPPEPQEPQDTKKAKAKDAKKGKGKGKPAKGKGKPKGKK